MDWDAATTVAGEIAQAWTQEGGPGGAVLLFDGQDIRAEAAGGLASLELSLPFRGDTAVRYASISKHFLCALLAVDGTIRFTDTLGDHLKLTPALDAVEVARALDMTGGLPDAMETLWLLGVPPSASMGCEALLRFVSAFPALNFPAGTEISYSNTGYRLVQAALASQGIDYTARLHEKFFRPLGLTVRLPEDETDPVPNLAGGYWRSERGWLRGRYGLHISASGGLAGSARDLVAWLQSLTSRRGPAGDALATLGARRHLLDGSPTGYGLGLARSTLGEAIVIGHGGSLPGFKNQFLLAPEHSAGVVVVSNREDTDAHALALSVMGALLGIAPPKKLGAALPEGLFVAPYGPYWLEQHKGIATFLGADAVLDEGDNAAETHSAHLPMRLRAGDDGGITGEIGYVARTFRPASSDLTASPTWAGHWVCPEAHASLDIAVADGTAHLIGGTGPLHASLKLTPIAPDRALAERREGAWRQRPCLQFSGNELSLVSNRSRMLRFVRD